MTTKNADFMRLLAFRKRLKESNVKKEKIQDEICNTKSDGK